ncbi:50S ribosomal protein L33 [candidate division WWE3 bacterium]|uniref:Large ribosomal subunit protein bL33 n=1 Tax=candidate division WWE3 bacterium TaxID=2053526 RepID=A0A955RX29_UNCKA|nr:50S ribosomal protein L33 [candidate division WWE3 bacterium]
MAKDRRMVVVLKCKNERNGKTCNRENYSTTTIRENYKDLEVQKFCRECREHTLHKAIKPSSNRK